MKTFVRSLLFIGLVLGLASCSKLNWAVRFADFYLTNQIDDFLDLTSAQKKESKAEVAKVVKEIRSRDFPKLAGVLEKAAARLEATAPLERPWLDEWNDELLEILRSSLQRFEPLALSLQSSSSSEQETHFRKEMNRRTEKLRQDASDPKRSLKKGRERVLRWIEFFVTDLTDEQTEMIEAFAKKHPVDFEAEIKNREHLLASFLKTHGEERKDWIRRFFADPDALRPEASVDASRKRQIAMKDLFVRLWDRLSEKQRDRVKETLKEKAAEFRRLSL
ncbi:MAG TPA: DUF6279 family lipoprotein [Pseudobdellovibrionaceae bacterium]|nr:DUF6279 family lipoprotein [Pseudobdellovibrionaceae bacterium]